MTGRPPVRFLLTAENTDAREAMGALIKARCLAWREDEPCFPKELAKLAWRIADAMAEERAERSRGRRP